jgi:hypothetical protein
MCINYPTSISAEDPTGNRRSDLQRYRFLDQRLNQTVDLGEVEVEQGAADDGALAQSADVLGVDMPAAARTEARVAAANCQRSRDACNALWEVEPFPERSWSACFP